MLSARPYGLFAAAGTAQVRWRIPAPPEDLRLAANLLIRGVLLDDLLLLMPAAARSAITEAVAHGSQHGWLSVQEVPPPDPVRDGVAVLDTASGWDGLAAVASLVGQVPVAARVHAGARVIVASLPAGAPACGECALRWYVGSERYPVEVAEWLRTAAALGLGMPDGRSAHDDVLEREIQALRAGTATARLLLLAADGTVEQEVGLVRHPSCSAATGRHGAPAASGGSAQEVLLERSRILHSLFVEELTHPAHPAGAHFLAGCAINTATRAGLLDPVFCFGDASDRDAAVLRSLSEGAERYCTFHYDRARLQVCRMDELPGDPVPPPSLPLFSEEQYRQRDFRYSRFDPSQRYAWIDGVSLRSGETRFVPAEAVFTTCRPASTGPLLSASSTGAAAHPDRDQAVLNALLETLERDALALAFLLNLRLPVLEPTDAWTRETAGVLAEEGYRVHLLGLRSDVSVPMVLVLGTRPSGPAPFIVKGASAAASVEQAMRKAMQEAWRGFLYFQKHPEMLPTRTVAVPPDSIAYGMAYYQDPDAAASLERFVGGPSTGGEAPQLDPHRPLADLVQRIVDAGMEPVVVDTTLPEVRAAGLTCVKAIAPGTIPVSFGRRPWQLGGDRLDRLATTLGSRGRLAVPGVHDCPPHFFT